MIEHSSDFLSRGLPTSFPRPISVPGGDALLLDLQLKSFGIRFAALVEPGRDSPECWQEAQAVAERIHDAFLQQSGAIASVNLPQLVAGASAVCKCSAPGIAIALLTRDAVVTATRGNCTALVSKHEGPSAGLLDRVLLLSGAASRALQERPPRQHRSLFESRLAWHGPTGSTMVLLSAVQPEVVEAPAVTENPAPPSLPPPVTPCRPDHYVPPRPIGLGIRDSEWALPPDRQYGRRKRHVQHLRVLAKPGRRALVLVAILILSGIVGYGLSAIDPELPFNDRPDSIHVAAAGLDPQSGGQSVRLGSFPASVAADAIALMSMPDGLFLATLGGLYKVDPEALYLTPVVEAGDQVGGRRLGTLMGALHDGRSIVLIDGAAMYTRGWNGRWQTERLSADLKNLDCGAAPCLISQRTVVAINSATGDLASLSDRSVVPQALLASYASLPKQTAAQAAALTRDLHLLYADGSIRSRNVGMGSGDRHWQFNSVRPTALWGTQGSDYLYVAVQGESGNGVAKLNPVNGESIITSFSTGGEILQLTVDEPSGRYWWIADGALWHYEPDSGDED